MPFCQWLTQPINSLRFSELHCAAIAQPLNAADISLQDLSLQKDQPTNALRLESGNGDPYVLPKSLQSKAFPVRMGSLRGCLFSCSLDTA